MTAYDDEIPIEGVYRGVPLHSGQTETRLVVVRADIDIVHAMQDLDDLVPFADSAAHAPEARLFAMAKSIAVLDEAVDRRAARSRTTVWSRERIKASAAACGSLHWQSPRYYCSVLCSPAMPGYERRVRREVPLPDKYARAKPSNLIILDSPRDHAH